ncbi:SMC family ATPase [Candidatus Micrarchaeota archaeon]|nr:SMC family ATPase [Candidatus Micrarchaeota archaeon]
MITKLHLKRWKSHEDTVMNFGKGTNLFIGKMGSGKSSAIDGISFALFGTFPALKARKTKLEELVMQRPKKHLTAEIELEFIINEKTYKIVRQLSGSKSTSAQLFEEGKLIEAQTSRVSELIENLLKIDYDLFSRIIYAEQNRIDYLLMLPKGDRKKQVDELLGIARFEEVRAGANSAINKISQEKGEIEAYLQGSGGSEIKIEREKKQGEKEHAQKEVEKKQTAANGIKENIHAQRKKVLELSQMEAKIVGLQKEIAANESVMKSKEAELLELGEMEGKDIAKMENELKELQNHLHKKELEFDLEKGKKAKMDAQLEAFERGIAKLQKATEERKILEERKARAGSLEDSKKHLKKLEEEGTLLQMKIGGLHAQAKELELSTKSLHLADGKCPVCETLLEPEKKIDLQRQKEMHLKTNSAEIAKCELQIRENRNEAENAKRKVWELEEISLRLETFSATDAEFAKAKDEVNKIKHEHAQILPHIAKLESALNAQRKESAALEKEFLKLQKAPKLTHEIEELKKAHRKLEHEILAIKISPKEKEEATEHLLQFEKRSSVIGSEINALEFQIIEKARSIADLDAKLLEIGKREKRIELLKGKITKLNDFQEAVVETQTAMREQLIDAMNFAMNSLWKTIYPYGDFQEIKLKPLEDDYAFMLSTSQTEWVGIENCSGGEKSCAALTLRVAFAMVLTPSLSWLILDEPTHNLDSQAVQLLNRALHDEIPKIVGQTFIITHDEALKEGASSKIFYFERDKDNNERTVVEELSEN